MNSVGRGNICRAFLIILMVAAASARPLAAQNSQTSRNRQPAAGTGAAGSGDAIGPEQLRNFSLGAPAAQAPPQPVPPDLIAPSANRPQRPAPRPAPVTPNPVTTTAAPPATVPTPTATPAPAPAGRPLPSPVPRAAASSSVTVALPPADPLARAPTRAGEGEVPRLSSQPMGPDAPLQSAGDGGDDPALLPWIVALLMLGGAAIFYALRTRGRPLAEPTLAGPVLTLPRELPPRSFPPAPPPAAGPPAAIPPAAIPPAAIPATQPSALVGGITVKRPNAFARPAASPPAAAAPPRPIGIVSTRLRPQLEVEFEPTQATIDETLASVQFDVVVTNGGSAPARNVLIEACMVNAGPGQDTELRRFFDAPVGQGDRIDSIPPLGRISLKSAVSLPLDQVRAYEVGGRRLFVPLVAFNALYEWGSGQGQSSAAFILGRASSASDGEGDPDAKMAPLRLDLGPRVFRGLEGRRHPLGMRR